MTGYFGVDDGTMLRGAQVERVWYDELKEGGEDVSNAALHMKGVIFELDSNVKRLAKRVVDLEADARQMRDANVLIAQKLYETSNELERLKKQLTREALPTGG